MPEPAHTVQPDAPPPMADVASDPPLLFLAVLWLPAFAVVAWGMMLLFGSKPWEFSNRADAIPVPTPPPLDPPGAPPPEPPLHAPDEPRS